MKKQDVLISKQLVDENFTSVRYY